MEGILEYMFKTGQWIYAIDVVDEDYESAEINEYLFMAECGDYIICCSEYIHWENDFTNQLKEMCEESIRDYGVEVFMLKKDMCFETKNQANDYLVEMKECD